MSSPGFLDQIQTGWRTLRGFFAAPRVTPPTPPAPPPPPPPAPAPVPAPARPASQTPGLTDALPPSPLPYARPLDLSTFPYARRAFRRAVYSPIRKPLHRRRSAGAAAREQSQALSQTPPPSPFFVIGGVPRHLPASVATPPRGGVHGVHRTEPWVRQLRTPMQMAVTTPQTQERAVRQVGVMAREVGVGGNWRRPPRAPGGKIDAQVRKSIVKRTAERRKEGSVTGLLRRQGTKMERGVYAGRRVMGLWAEEGTDVRGEWRRKREREEMEEKQRMDMMRKADKDARARKVENWAKEFAGLDMTQITQELSPEFVELMEENPMMAVKIFKLMGKGIREMVEAKGRAKQRNVLIQREQKERERLEKQARLEEEKRRALVGEPRPKQAEMPPEDASYFRENYWSDKGDSKWDEGADEKAIEEREMKVSVTDDESAFAPLTNRALKRLRHQMMESQYSARELAKVNGCVITSEDLVRLKPGCWLNDEIVNAYLELLGKRNEMQKAAEEENARFGKGTSAVPKIKVMNSFFYAKLVQFNRAQGRSVYDYTRVRRWTRRFDAFSFDIMLIPINQSNTHWTLGVVNFKEKKVEHLDSMGNGGSDKVRKHLMSWVQDEAKDKKKPFSADKWKMVPREVPQQLNSDDCGVFLCKFADFISRGWEMFTFSQEHMNYFRSRIAHELLMERAT